MMRLPLSICVSCHAFVDTRHKHIYVDHIWRDATDAEEAAYLVGGDVALIGMLDKYSSAKLCQKDPG